MSELVEKIRADREAREEAAALRLVKRDMTARDKAWKDSAKAGYETGRDEERRRAKAKPKKRPAAKRRRRAGYGRTAARQIARPLTRQAVSGMSNITLLLGVVALYLVLQNAGAVSGFLGGISRGLQWLSAPNRSVPYR